LLNEKNLAIIARHRQAIVSRRGSQGQYVEQFNESVLAHITKAFETAKTIRPTEKQTIIVTNLLILMDGLGDVRYAILAMNKLEDENMIVRYWAVQYLANPGIIKQLNDGKASNPNRAQEITEKLKKIVPVSSPEILNTIMRYAAAINIPQGEELLLQTADRRINSYTDGSVTLEYIDVNNLKILESIISNPSEESDVPALAQRFAQLYSYVIQRYSLGKDSLNQVQKNQLITVIVEIEDKCIRNMVGTQQNLRKAIESNQSLMEEHNRLLGSDTTQGQLPVKYKFNYGKNENGSARNAPLALPRP
jgi:hypothetical protein